MQAFPFPFLCPSAHRSPVCIPPVMEAVGTGGVKLDRPREVRDGPRQVPQPLPRYPPVVVRKGVARLRLDGPGVVGDRLRVRTELVEGEAAVEEGLEVPGI